MAEPMSDARLAEIRADHATYLSDVERYGLSGLVRGARIRMESIGALLAEVDRLRALLGEPETVWGHQVHGDDGWIGEAVPQGSEATARRAVHLANKRIGADSGTRARLVVHEVWHAETEWRVADDAA